MVMPDPPLDGSQVLAHRGPVAGLFAALGRGAVIAQAPQPNPAMRARTGGEAGNALGRKGLGCSPQALALVPRFCHQQPTDRLISPRVAPDQRTDDALGRAVAPRSADGVPERYRLLAATAAGRWGLTPRLAHRDRTRVHVEGRDHRDAAPAPPVMHRTRGERREPRPARHPGLWELMVGPQAGIPLLRPPRRGHSRDAHALGQVLRASIAPWYTTSGVTSVVAESALDRAATRHHLAPTAMPWSTRVPATVRAAHAALAQVDLPALAALHAGSRAHALPATDGGLGPRGGRIDSERRQPPAQRTVDRPLRQPSDTAVNAWKPGWGPTLACAADARQALAPVAPAVQATLVGASPVRATPRYRTRGRPRHGAHPDPVGYQLAAAFAAALATRHARLDPHRCGILATTALNPPSARRQTGWRATKARCRRHADAAFCKTRRFWPPRCL
jgi:Domain of unknown function (DUF4277)